MKIDPDYNRPHPYNGVPYVLIPINKASCDGCDFFVAPDECELLYDVTMPPCITDEGQYIWKKAKPENINL